MKQESRPFFRAEISPQRSLSREVDVGRGSPHKEIEIFWTRPKTFAPPDFEKTIAPCILESHFSTNLIFSGLV